MDDLYQNKRIFSNNLKDIGDWGYIEIKCSYQSYRNYCRYGLGIPSVLKKVMPAFGQLRLFSHTGSFSGP